MPTAAPSALDRARRKAALRLLPMLFLCYAIAYVDRNNVAIASLTMKQDLPGFTDGAIGFGAGVFFAGYFLLEIPGSLIVERWSARKWISRIMLSWGLVAALTACVRLPWHFYVIRFTLGLAEAGFFPGVIVYLTHWFPSRDRARALSWFFVATPVAQIVSPKLSNLLLKVGTDEVVNGVKVHHPEVWGLEGWQWVYIAWGLPAVLLGLLVLVVLTDRPGQARWLEADEREALEAELEREKGLRRGRRHMTVVEALSHPKVLILAAAYFFVVSGNYGTEFFLPRILKKWYSLDYDRLTWLVILPPIGSLASQVFTGWNSDRVGERRLHVVAPIVVGAAAMGALALLGAPPLWLTVTLFMLVAIGTKAYLPPFWALPSIFLSESAAAGSIGLINSVGNLGGLVGPSLVGWLADYTKSFRPGLLVLCVSMCVSAAMIYRLGLGRRSETGDSRDG